MSLEEFAGSMPYSLVVILIQLWSMEVEWVVAIEDLYPALRVILLKTLLEDEDLKKNLEENGIRISVEKIELKRSD